MNVFAPTEIEGDFDLVSILQKLADVPDLGLKIVFRDIGVEFDFLYVLRMLVFARLAFPPVLFVLKFPKIHDAANRGIGIGRDFDQVKVDGPGPPDGFIGRDHPHHTAIRRDTAYLGNPDPVIDTNE